MHLSFTVPGRPVPWKRAQGVARYTDPTRKAYAARVRLAAIAQLQERKCRPADMPAPPWPLDALYAVTLVVVPADKRRRDADNFAKLALDACNGVLFADDSQVRDLRVLVSEPDEPRLDVMIEVLTAADIAAAIAEVA